MDTRLLWNTVLIPAVRDRWLNTNGLELCCPILAIGRGCKISSEERFAEGRAPGPSRHHLINTRNESRARDVSDEPSHRDVLAIGKEQEMTIKM